MSCMNDTKKGYRAYPLCDSHVHLAYPMHVNGTAHMLESFMTYFGLEGLCLLALPHSSRAKATDPANNVKALYLKHVLSARRPGRRIYAFGGLYHHFDARDTAQGLLAQVKALKSAGFDGLKLLYGKPPLRRRLGVGLDDSLFAEVWRFCEKERFPVTLHPGDPAEFWRAGENGEPPVYGPDDTPLETIRTEIRNVLSACPELDITLCHFAFLADDIGRADRLLSSYPGVKFDLAPGSEMFYHFSQDPSSWRDFFIRHSKRILFGTDTDNWGDPDRLEGCEHCFSYPFNLVRSGLEGKAPFRFEDRDYGLLTPLSLPESALEDIYFRNLISRLGKPKSVDADALAAEAERLLALSRAGLPADSDAERQRLNRESLETICTQLRPR